MNESAEVEAQTEIYKVEEQNITESDENNEELNRQLNLMLSLVASDNVFIGSDVITQANKEFISIGLILIVFTVFSVFVMGGYFYLLSIEAKIEKEWVDNEESMLRIDDDTEQKDCYVEKLKFLNS